MRREHRELARAMITGRRQVMPITWTREGCRVLRDVYRDGDGNVTVEAITLMVPA